MTKYFITGGAGFIGSHFCEKIVENGSNFICIDNLFRGKIENIDLLLESEKNIFKKIDISKYESIGLISEILSDHQPEYIIHYAAINGTQYFYDIPFDVAEVNSIGTCNLLKAVEMAVNKNVAYSPKIIFASSSEVYGDPVSIPTTESDMTYLRIEEVRDSYAAGKLMSEFFIKTFCIQFNLSYYIYRIFNVYGPRMIGSKYGQVIPEFIQRLENGEYPLNIIGSGNQTRSFCNVLDHVDLAWKAMHKAAPNNVYNIGNTAEINIIDLATLIMKKMKLDSSFNHLEERSGDPQRRSPNIAKILDQIGNHEFIELSEGIDTLLKSQH